MQGSVATCLTRGGSLIITLLQIYCRVCQRNNFENRLINELMKLQNLMARPMLTRPECCENENETSETE